MLRRALRLAGNLRPSRRFRVVAIAIIVVGIIAAAATTTTTVAIVVVVVVLLVELRLLCELLREQPRAFRVLLIVVVVVAIAVAITIVASGIRGVDLLLMRIIELFKRAARVVVVERTGLLDRIDLILQFNRNERKATRTQNKVDRKYQFVAMHANHESIAHAIDQLLQSPNKNEQQQLIFGKFDRINQALTSCICAS
jgi:hypothetical protein